MLNKKFVELSKNFVVIVILSLMAYSFTVPRKLEAQTKVSLGAKVMLTAQSNIRTIPILTPAQTSGSLLGVLPAAATGTVVQGPIFENNFNWWDVKFDGCAGQAGLIAVACTGWVGESSLMLNTSTQPPPPTVVGSLSLACSPQFTPVTMNTFVPTGAKGVGFTVTNTGQGPITLVGVTTIAPFTAKATDSFPISLAIGQSEAFTATFVPTAKGTFTANVVVQTNSSAAGGTINFGVTGISQ